MPRLFLSYRRRDKAMARSIYEPLAQRFGSTNVFFDVNSIPFGVDFVEYLDHEVARCDILVAAIGPGWIAEGRLHHDDDFVRIEIAAALERKKAVLPVLIDGTSMPNAAELPEPLRPLCRRNAFPLDTGRDFQRHVAELIRIVESMTATSTHSSATPPSSARTTKNSLGMHFAHIEPGSFSMGAPTSDPQGRDVERPQHRVTLSRGFDLATHLVTRGQFARFVADTGHKTDAEALGGWQWNKEWSQDARITWRTPGFEQTDTHPVVVVSWNDAKRFLAWLERVDGDRYRLPTEAEWEYACRAGTATRYFTGDAPTSLQGYANVADATFYKDYLLSGDPTVNDGYVYTSPVGSFQANPWGLLDMAGNVWEWCEDFYGDRVYLRGNCKDPAGPLQGTRRVTRGGAWNTHPIQCASWYRDAEVPDRGVNVTGMRVVRCVD